MRAVLYLFLAVIGLSGCVTRNRSREQFYAYKDSMVYIQLDTSCLHYDRQKHLRGNSRLKEIYFSSPDSSGKQHVERVTYVTEEWSMTDSAEVLSTKKSATEKQDINSIISTEKVMTKHEPGHIAGWVLVLFLLSFVYWLWKKWRIK